MNKGLKHIREDNDRFGFFRVAKITLMNKGLKRVFFHVFHRCEQRVAKITLMNKGLKLAISRAASKSNSIPASLQRLP